MTCCDSVKKDMQPRWCEVGGEGMKGGAREGGRWRRERTIEVARRRKEEIEDEEYFTGADTPLSGGYGVHETRVCPISYLSKWNNRILLASSLAYGGQRRGGGRG